jgi:predicted flap endonuclease-1-like 5' DNA nuclease
LLAAVAQPKERQELADKLGLDVRKLLELGNRADLGRIRGIGVVYSDLLEFAGVDTVAELATRKPENLFKKIMEVAAEHTVKRPPTAEDVPIG